MHLNSLHLLVFYGGFGFALALVWAAVMSDLVEGEPPPWAIAATNALRVVAVIHPAAAIAAFDLRRQASRRRNEQPTTGEFPITLGVSLFIAVIAYVLSR